MAKYKVLTEPLTAKDMDEDGWVEGVVVVGLCDTFDGFEPFLAVLSQCLVGDECLMEIDYEIVGFERGNILHVQVSGDATMSFENRE